MFLLQDQPALHSGDIVKTLLKHGRRTSWWQYKVNSYRLNRGPYSSTGYLLMTRASLRALGIANTSDDNPEIGPYTLQITPNIVIENVMVIKATAASPGSVVNDSTPYVVQLGDSRIHLENTYLDRDFNVVEKHDDTKLHFFSGTGKTDTEGFTWKELIDYLWDQPSTFIGDLVQDASLYPSIKPNNYLFDGLSVADALDRILSDLGLIFYYDILDGKYYIRGLDETSTPFLELTQKEGNNYMGKLREIRYQEHGESNDLPGKLIFNFPSRKYEISTNNLSPVSAYVKEPSHTIERTVAENDPPYPYSRVNSELSLSIPVNPTAFFSPAGGSNPVNQSELDDFLDKVSRRYQRKMASQYGPVIVFGELLPNDSDIKLYPGRSLAAITWFFNVSEKGNTTLPKTTVEVPDTAAYSQVSSSRKNPRGHNPNYPEHRSIIVRPKTSLDDKKVGQADVIEYAVSSNTASRSVAGVTPILNLSGKELKTDIDYTASFHWRTQQWAIWPGASNSGEGGGGGTPSNESVAAVVRFRLLEDLEIGQGYAEAQLINENGDSIDYEGNTVVDAGGVSNWLAGQQVAPGALRKATVPDPLSGRFAIGDIIRNLSDVPRTTGNIFNTQEAALWEKYTFAGNIIVVDPEVDNPEGGKFYAYGPYNQPKVGVEGGEDIKGFTGLCSKIGGDSGEDYGGTGLPGFYIIMVESLARWIEGQVIEGSVNTQEKSFLIEINKYWGAYPNQRKPKTAIFSTGSSSKSTNVDSFKVYYLADESPPDDNLTGTARELRRALYNEAENKYWAFPYPRNFKFDYIILELELEP